MTSRANQALLFTGASLLTLPFIVVLAGLATIIFLPTPPLPPIALAVVLYGAFLIPHPIGISLMAIAAGLVWQSLRLSRTRAFRYPLLVYAAILIAVAIYDALGLVTGLLF